MFSPGAVIKRFLPRTLLGRSLLIIVSPLILLQIISAWVFFERHWDTVSVRLARGLAGDIAATMALLRENPGPEGRKATFTFAHTHFRIRASLKEKAILKNATPTANPDRLERVLRKALNDRMSLPLAIDSRSFDRDVIIDIQLPDGVLHLIAPRKRLFTSTTYLFVALMAGSSLILFAVAMMFMRNQIRPIRRLAMAADALGKGREVSVFRLQGATEVRQAANAFNRMRERLQRQVTQRTEMLAGVSHDLRTPLTRMKLQLAMLEDTPGVEELKDDVEEMERMVEGYLAFARGEGNEPMTRTNLRELVEDVVAAARRAGGIVDYTAEGALTLAVRKEDLRRCIANLISNATQYGTRAAVGVVRKPDSVELTIDDDGPGIPEDKHETVFRPFSRLEQSRNVETGGVGLGLTIARDVVHAHGGDIALSKSPLGGLRVRLILPA
ncbi:MAG: ATP-binding protein [Alphaproteobacteria bacterium]|nr:ATP-binding protein [Alphaproteobacteria bacterium]